MSVSPIPISEPDPAAPPILTGGNIFQRLNRVMQQVSYVQKEKKPGMRYSIVSHDAVTNLVRDPLVGQGVIYFPVHLSHTKDGNRTEVELTVRFQNVDDKDDYFDVPSIGYGIDDQDKGCGKAISYAVKYALLKALGLESGDDPDNDQETRFVSTTAIKVSKSTDLEIEEATSPSDLAEIEKKIREDFENDKIDKATAVSLRSKIRLRLKALQND